MLPLPGPCARGQGLVVERGFGQWGTVITPPRRRRTQAVLAGLLLALFLFLPGVAPAWAGLDDDRYDGNIFALYAGNGSLVPPRSTLAEALAAGRVAVVVYYLDDSSVS